MSCNLFSYLGGRNIRSHRWSKSSLRPTASEHQKHWEPSKKVRLVGSDARRHPTLHARETLTRLLHNDTVLFMDMRIVSRLNESTTTFRKVRVVSRSITLEASHLKLHKGNSSQRNKKTCYPRKKTFAWFKTKKSSKSGKRTIHNINSNWSPSKHQKRKNCNVFQFVFRSRWHEFEELKMTKPSVRATATEHQKQRAIKEGEIGWFWREATPNSSCERNFDTTSSKW